MTDTALDLNSLAAELRTAGRRFRIVALAAALWPAVLVSGVYAWQTRALTTGRVVTRELLVRGDKGEEGGHVLLRGDDHSGSIWVSFQDPQTPSKIMIAGGGGHGLYFSLMGPRGKEFEQLFGANARGDISGRTLRLRSEGGWVDLGFEEDGSAPLRATSRDHKVEWKAP